MDPRLAKRQRCDDSFNQSGIFSDSDNPNNNSNGTTPNNTPNSSQKSVTKPYHEMTTKEVESMVTAVRKETPKSSVEMAKQGIDSKLWSEIFDVQTVKEMKALPTDTNGMLVAKASLRQPLKIGEYSLKISSRGSERLFINDSSELKYLHVPPVIADISLDLTHGYEMVKDIHWGKPSYTKLDELLQWISLNRKKFMVNGETVPQSLNTDFVCYRGLLSKIMVSPYENTNRWVICATKFKGTIYLCEFHETYPPPDNYYNKLSFGGFRFEQYLTSYYPEIPPDPNDFDPDHHEYCAVMRTRLMSEKLSHSLVFGAELDAIIPNVMETGGFLKNFVELKTTKRMENEYQYRNFLKYKLLKWWAQSYLVGVPLIVCGYKDNKGIVKKLEQLNIESFPDLCVEFWSANVCLNFLNKFLNHVKELVTIDDPNVVYQFAFQPQTNITCTRLTDPGEFQILPNWYIKELAR